MGERFICGTFDLSSYPEMEEFDGDEGCGKDFVSKVSLMDHVRTAHLGLKGIANTSRKVNNYGNTEGVDQNNDEEEVDHEDRSEGPSEEEYVPKRKSKRSLKAKAPVREVSPVQDPRRTISCLSPGCQQMFIRQYDMQVHMRAAHPISFPGMDGDFDDQFLLMNGLDIPPSEPGMGTHDQGPDPQHVWGGFATTGSQSVTGGLGDALDDFDWELQRQALEGGQFWIGADSGLGDLTIDDEWNHDESEMQRLIGRGY